MSATRLVVSAVDGMTAVGLDAATTAAAVRAGISRLRASEQFVDSYGNPITEACLPWVRWSEADDDTGEDAPDDGLPKDAPADDAPADDQAADDQAADLGDDEDGAVDPYAAAREGDDHARVVDAARRCLEDLLAAHFPVAATGGSTASLLVGVSERGRPGPRFEGAAEEVAATLGALLRRHVPRSDVVVVPAGNAAVLRGVALAAHYIAHDPTRVCVIAGLDSLLPLETLNWYEAAGRLKSVTPGRNHGLSPAEAVGLVVVETAESAARAGRVALATVAGVGHAVEPNPFLTDRPSRGEGLTAACRAALAASGLGGAEVRTVLADLDGEFHRAKEWALTETRCLGGSEPRALLHPADCFGAVGAASGAVLLGIAAVGLAAGWLTGPTLIVCSDDAGACGAVVLTPVPTVQRR